jgi:5-methylthioadenosine/S-adenosylhomocysteine deaminase
VLVFAGEPVSLPFYPLYAQSSPTWISCTLRWIRPRVRLSSKESRMNFPSANPLHRKSGGGLSLSWLLVCCLAIAIRATPAFAKQRVDLIVVHGTVVTMDEKRRILKDGAIAVQGDAIAAVDTTANIDALYESGRVIDARGGLILPGLINAHTHMSMSLFRGLADDLSLDDWLNKYIFPAEHRYVTRDFVTWSTRLSLLEMLRGGTTTVADMYYFEEEVAEATKAAGMRGVLGETLIGFPSPDSQTPAAALTYTELFLKHWKGDPLITPAVAPHSIYTCPETLLKDAAALAQSNQAPLLIHVAEAPFEIEKSRHDHGLTTVQYLARIGMLGPNVLGAHCIWLDQADVQTLAHFGVGCSYNPSSNMKTAAGLMPAVELLSAGVAVGIGTDGAASNNNQDMFEEMDLAAKQQKFARMDPKALPAAQVVEMATITGARALHLERQIGSLEVGKKADLIVVDTSAAHATPMYDVYSAIVYALKSSDVRTTVIGGKVVMEDRRMLTLDEPAILAKATEYAKQIDAFFDARNSPAGR